VRLVDADKQLEWVDCMKPIHGIGLEPVVAVETVRDLIKGVPTIDAIPVEWLEAVLEEAKEFPRMNHETIVAIPYLIYRWQREQEAQDG